MYIKMMVDESDNESANEMHNIEDFLIEMARKG